MHGLPCTKGKEIWQIKKKERKQLVFLVAYVEVQIFIGILCNHNLKLDQMDMTSDLESRGSEFNSHLIALFTMCFSTMLGNKTKREKRWDGIEKEGCAPEKPHGISDLFSTVRYKYYPT